MAVQVVIRITFLLLLTTYELAEAAAPIAKPNCSDSCGDIYIPYPFGKTPDCYLNDWFKIVCNETGGSLKAFLPSIGMEVLEINITDPYNNYYFWNDPGLVRVNMPIISSECKNGSSRHIGGVNISGSPFFFSSYRDSFISVGCDNLAIMIGINPMVVVGCKSNCDNKSMIDDSEFEYCSGFNCCMTAIPSRKSKTGIQVFNASFESGEECKFAFLADDKWLNSRAKDLSYYVQFLEYVPVVLEWTASEFITLDPNELRRRNSAGYPTLYGAQYYYCLKGYQGNSYLSTGCQGKLQLPTSFHFLAYSSSFHYFNSNWFKIVCNETGGSLKAFLPSIGMEVLEINITDPYNNYYFWNDPGLVRVNMPIISSECKNGSSRHIGGVNISGSPFFFSSYRDSFISVGCDNLAIMIGINPMVVVGCKSNCDNKSMIDDSEFEYCSGFNCCMTAIPSRKSKTGIQVFNASFESGEECKFAFLADDKWLNSRAKDLSYYVQFLEYVPVVLEWTASEFITLDPNELRRRNSAGYPTLYGAQYYYCLKGYQGNSYLSTGCQVL
nr:wall-associated receptor kinase-like 8 [Quercus suber]